MIEVGVLLPNDDSRANNFFNISKKEARMNHP